MAAAQTFGTIVWTLPVPELAHIDRGRMMAVGSQAGVIVGVACTASLAVGDTWDSQHSALAYHGDRIVEGGIHSPAVPYAEDRKDCTGAGLASALLGSDSGC